jgi:hypothetical protein
LSEELTATKQRIEADNSDLVDTVGRRDDAIVELGDLHASCVDTGMSYEERVERRRDEMDALHEAFDVLDNYKA